MAIKGSLKEASLPDVLQLLALGNKSGCLSLVDRNNLGYIYFVDGRITFASIVNRRDRFGDLLVKHGKVTTEQLEAAVRRQADERERKLGELLVEGGAISQQELEAFVRIQVEEAVFFLFTWTQGSFQFDADVVPDDQDILLSINPESLLLEGARRIDEWGLIEKKVPSFQAVFSLETARLETADVTLTAEQRMLAPLVDGAKDVASLIEETGLSEFDVGKALYGLITAGFAHRVRVDAPSVAKETVSEVRIDEHRNLGIAFYKTGMLDEAIREFRRVIDLKEMDPAAHFYLGLVAIKNGEWEVAEKSFRRADDIDPRPVTKSNLGLCLEQLGRLEDAESVYGDSVSKARQDVIVLTNWGVAALRLQKYEVAEGRLDRAREVAADKPLPEVWYWARAMVEAVVERYGPAVTLLQEGLEKYKSSSVLQNNLAVLYEVQGEIGKAEEILRAAESEGAELPQLSKNLGDVLYRAGRHDEAWDAYQRAVKLAPDLGDDTYFKLGNIAYKRMDQPTATAMWNKTLELNPDHQLAKTNLDTMNALQ